MRSIGVTDYYHWGPLTWTQFLTARLFALLLLSGGYARAAGAVLDDPGVLIEVLRKKTT